MSLILWETKYSQWIIVIVITIITIVIIILDNNSNNNNNNNSNNNSVVSLITSDFMGVSPTPMFGFLLGES